MTLDRRTHVTEPDLEAYGLQGPEAYAYTSLSNCLDVQGIDDVQDFGETIVSSRQCDSLVVTQSVAESHASHWS